MLEGEFIRILYIYKRNKIKKFERILYLKLTSVKIKNNISYLSIKGCDDIKFVKSNVIL
jgi:hypothetical protein